MQLTLVVTAVACASAALAGPLGLWSGNGHHQGQCLSAAQVNTLITSYTYLLEHSSAPNASTIAHQILSDKFLSSSDSYNSLSQMLPDQPIRLSREVSRVQTPPLPVVQTLEIFAGCNHIAWRRNLSGVDSKQHAIRGINVMDVNVATTQIDAIYSEFDTLAVAAILGYPECQEKERIVDLSDTMQKGRD